MSASQYVIFKLDEGEFGISIMNIREIIPYKEPTSLPDSPEFIRGILNHRGSVVPIISLKERLKLGEFKESSDSRIIIVTIDDYEVGFLVDEASQTLMLNEEEIEATPEYLNIVDKKYIKGVGKLEDEKLLIILDLKKTLTERELTEVKEQNK